MATTYINQDLLSVVITTFCLIVVTTAACGACYLSYVVGVWVWTRQTERRVAGFLSRFDTHECDREDALAYAGVVGGDAITQRPAGVVRGWQRIRRDNITEIAFALADEAYLFYGRRDKSKANDLVTRKFLRDQLSEYDSLRAKDKSRIIEIALTLSYVPPSEAEDMQVVARSAAYGRRVATRGFSIQ